MKKKSLIALVMAFSLLFTGCGGSDNSDAKNVAESSAKAEDTGGAESSNRWINVNASLPLNYDPASGSSSIDLSIVFNVYDTLVFTEIDGTVIPHVATDWECSDDGLIYTFHIRDDIKFHDGSPLEASDVAFSMNRALAIGEGLSYLWDGYVDYAEATDATTVVFHMKKTYAVFVSTLVRLAVLNEELVMANVDSSDSSYGDKGDYGKGWLATNDAGSGPYMTKEISITDYVTCEKYNDYWMGWGEKSPEGFTVRAINEAATIRTMMSNGELSITDEWETQDTLEALRNMDGLDVANIYSGCIMCLEMNTKKAPTDDIHLRKCLAYLFDYDTAYNYIYAGTEKAKGPVSKSYQGAIGDELNTYSYNVEKAKEELALSNYANNIGDYTIDLHYSTDVKDEEDLALLLQSAAAELGINITITATPFATLIAEAASQETTANITIMAPSDSYSEAGSVLKLHYHSDTAGTFTQFEWLLDDTLDDMIDSALAENDYDKRMSLYADAQRYIDDLCPTIWTIEWPEQRAYLSSAFKWPEAEAEKNAPIMGRSLYFRTIEFYN